MKVAWRVPGQVGFLEFRPTVEADRLEDARAGLLAVDEIGHRAGQVAGDGQKADVVGGVRGRAGNSAVEGVQVQRGVQQTDDRQPAHSEQGQ